MNPYAERDNRIWKLWCEKSGDSSERHSNFSTDHPFWKFCIEQEKLDKHQEAVTRYENSEKNHFTDYLVKIGYRPYRSMKRGRKMYCLPSLDFSTLMEGMLDIRFEKDDKIVIWGLNEHQKPPTLIFPRTRQTGFSDDDVNNFIATHTNEEVYNAILT